MQFQTVDIEGLHFANATLDSVVHLIIDHCIKGIGGWVVTPNTDILNRWSHDLTFKRLVEHVDLFIADGTPIVWASILQRTPLPERIAGSDLFVELSKTAHAAGLRVLLLGGNPGVAERAISIINDKFSGSGHWASYCPPFGFEENESEFIRMNALIADFKPHIVFVGLGSPKQELLISRIRSSAPEAWWIGVGVSFSFVTNDVKRAPLWVRNIGFEWLHRFMQEPQRLAKRYFITGIPFVAGLLLRSLMRGLLSRLSS